MIWCFGWEECEILAPQSGIKPSTPALEGKVSTNRPQVKSLALYHQSDWGNAPGRLSLAVAKLLLLLLMGEDPGPFLK